ncbi:MOSC domain-containing protein [Jeotgalibacillus soli]|uniref:Sulfurase n=1 Tax=Jeotgalibacillus soli TaxID=889306 RepID=A0A0C2SD92_9BACL|nr:MOSC domain-containing protein [Jeotgalibacillus soli]KIL51934.1 sulfurase [Jeotgalibacillus soli]
MLIGSMQEITRHPVKSFTGESVGRTKVMDYGLYGDRSHALMDETRPGEFLTITQFSGLAQYKAKFIGEESLLQYPQIEIITPNNRIFNWGDQALVDEIENLTKRRISLVEYKPAHVPFGAIEEENLLLVTDASLQRLKEIWGKEVDPRRFRPNLLIELNDKIPFVEETWFGKKLKIGKEVEIQLNRYCERCMIITVNPEDAKRDPSLLKTIGKERSNHFGVYASVIKTGEIQVGDEIYLLD